ncbi:pyruvate dehydrogenase (acetyl-transferring) E1 component subunit alpha [Altererythrobacter sp. RZ02]|uniref:Pyruvate dehydrogenase E1 component subunit alpha n=1 Tax=Pontixanthobacter rizhaonensis TaxID=2730337 RepID=A0A848QFT9_9SPHN|nr:pyruvate dehydrogenase (acetyl-transferring) E1 component subunit alpha [Pontixanthobacter rizhaonensis]NMW31462.1 pyruvate dehydrogenase (acetyl-transferring) E1 component subunit alpha [Pontixanthobacter rizhaonensis]
MAKEARTRKTPAKKAGSKTAASKAESSEDFALHSLQDAHEVAPSYDASDAELLQFYEQMLLIRRFEEKAGQLYGLGLIGGFCHLYIGQEAVAIGLQSALDGDTDSVITGYRDHGHMLAYGIDPNVIMAELTGRQAGISKGKGGSMHMFSTEHKFYGGHGIVGAQVALGGGLALAHQYDNDGGICLAYFGDGAANQGQVYETFNMAALWKLPIVFVVENNQYAMGTAVSRSSAETEFYRRGTAFRIPGMHVNGMDVLEVRNAAEIAFKHVRDGKGPVLMELNTYRYRGHSMSDPAKYRTRDEVQDMRDHKDPIEGLKKVLLERGKTEEELKAIDKAIRSRVAESADFAESSAEPEPSELYTDVLVEEY